MNPVQSRTRNQTPLDQQTFGPTSRFIVLRSCSFHADKRVLYLVKALSEPSFSYSLTYTFEEIRAAIQKIRRIYERMIPETNAEDTNESYYAVIAVYDEVLENLQEVIKIAIRQGYIKRVITT